MAMRLLIRIEDEKWVYEEYIDDEKV